MSIKPSLQILLDHAQKQSDDAAMKLGLLTSRQQQAEQKLHLLQEYRHSYQSKFQDSAKNGVSQVNWSNFNAFMKSLTRLLLNNTRTLRTLITTEKSVVQNFECIKENSSLTALYQNVIIK